VKSIQERLASKAMPKAIKVFLQLFGSFAIEAQGARAIPLAVTSRRGRALIAYLAMQPRYRASRQRLATLLWGDSGDAQARQSLRQCIASLRRDLRRALRRSDVPRSESSIPG
jgi:DNA-binding SARP family transcriptional activator